MTRKSVRAPLPPPPPNDPPTASPATEQVTAEPEGANDRAAGEPKSGHKSKKKKKKDAAKDFIKFLQIVNRNQYIRDQMVDRKARIVLSVNAVLLSLIVGKVIANHTIHPTILATLVFLGVASFASIVFAVLAVRPERTHVLSSGLGTRHEGEVLHSGPLLNEESYLDSVLAMRDDRPAIHSAIIRDTYYVSTVLQTKRRNLQLSLWAFIVGLSLSLVVAIAVRLLD